MHFRCFSDWLEPIWARRVLADWLREKNTLFSLCGLQVWHCATLFMQMQQSKKSVVTAFLRYEIFSKQNKQIQSRHTYVGLRYHNISPEFCSEYIYIYIHSHIEDLVVWWSFRLSHLFDASSFQWVAQLMLYCLKQYNSHDFGTPWCLSRTVSKHILYMSQRSVVVKIVKRLEYIN